MLLIPVVTTFKGKGAFPEIHPLSLGPIGMHGHAEANKIMIEADCVLAIGTRFSDRSVGTIEEFEKRLKDYPYGCRSSGNWKEPNNSTLLLLVMLKHHLRIMVKLLDAKSNQKR